MRPSSCTPIATVLVLFLAAAIQPLAAQQGATDDEATLATRACLAKVAAKDVAGAQVPARRAESLLKARLERQPRDVEALVGLARVTSLCLLPAVDLAGQGELSEQAIELLDKALEIEPTHWTARFMLASILYRSPSFAGRGPRAARELDALIQQQGERTENPAFARPFEYRGMLWSRARQPDSARAVWERGARLFPADSALRARLAAAAAGPAAPPAAGGTPRDSTRPPVAPTSSGAEPRRPTAALGAVRVVASAPVAPQPSTQTVDRSRVLMTPGATADVLQAVQLQPGATRVGEGSDVYTRGGDAAETSLSVDGGRLLSLSRFEGLNGGMFGALEPFVVRAVRYSSGGFSARHGNALSGVLEIETDGRPRDRQLRAGASLVQASGTARLPAGRRAGGWVSARASHTGALLATHGRGDEYDGAPHSMEAIGAFVVAPSVTSELRTVALVERDDARRIVEAAGWRGPFHSSGGIGALLVSGRWIATGAPVVVKGSVAASRRDSDWSFGVLARERDERSLVSRADVEWAPTGLLTVRGGVERGDFGRRERGTLPTSASVAPGAPTRTLADTCAGTDHTGGYGELQLARGAVQLVAGLRADELPGESGMSLDPRIAVAARRGAWTARASGGLFHQGRWRVAPAIPDAGTPSGMAGEARHLVLGLEREGATSTLRAEAFDKRYDDYAPLGAGPRVTAGRARGLDVIAQRRGPGRLTGWVGWSLLDAVVHLADGEWARSPYDVTHSLTASATATVARDWSVGSTVRYGTGTPVTPVVASTMVDGRVTPVYGRATSERLPAYARLDARVMRFIRLPGALVSSYVEVLNLANRRNAAGATWDASYTTRRLTPTFFASRTIVAGAEVQWR